MQRMLALSIIFILMFLFIPLASIHAQDETNIDTKELALCLTRNRFVMFSETQCSACALEKSYFGKDFSFVPIINCDDERELCDSKNIHAYPTWVSRDGTQYKGAMPLDILSKVSGCASAELESKPPEILSREHILGAFLAGLLSFLAPCLLPLLPSYFTVLTGFTFAELYGLNFERIRLRVFISSLFFVTGFSIVFTTIGATGSIVGKVFGDYLHYLLKASGLVLIVLGLVQTGVIKFDALRFDYAWNVQKRLAKLGYISALVMGIAAALSWIPCVGPLLSSVLLLTANSESVFEGGFLLLIYSFGLTTPFLLAGLFFPDVVRLLKDHRLALHRISVGAGIFLILFGCLLLVNLYQPFLDIFKGVPILGGF